MLFGGLFVPEELWQSWRDKDFIHMVFAMIGRLQESPKTLAILNPCF